MSQVLPRLEMAAVAKKSSLNSGECLLFLPSCAEFVTADEASIFLFYFFFFFFLKLVLFLFFIYFKFLKENPSWTLLPSSLYFFKSFPSSRVTAVELQSPKTKNVFLFFIL